MDKRKDKTNLKIFIINLLIFLFIFISYYQLWNTANIINNEISYRNYLTNQNKINMSLNGTIISSNNIEKLKFPINVKILLGITLLLILQSTTYLTDLFFKRKEEYTPKKN